MYYTVYKTVNLINEKEYVGFHSIKSLEDIQYEVSETGSIFKDGYLGSGKNMKRALQKYGPMNMKQELLLVTNDRKEAEELEREIVCREWVERDDTYNLSVGGNVTILFGEHNGFYGKKHRPETIEKAIQTRETKRQESPFSWCESFLKENEEVVFYNKNDIIEYFDLKQLKGLNLRFEINRLVYEGVIRYKSEYLQKAKMQSFLKRGRFLSDTNARTKAKEKLAKLAKERFTGIPKTEDSNKKRSVSIKKWIDENPKKHKERMLKINQNPEKIEKSAMKHRGMKRSKEARKNISESLKGKTPSNKGKISIHNSETGEMKYIDRDQAIPEGWKRGMGKRK